MILMQNKEFGPWHFEPFIWDLSNNVDIDDNLILNSRSSRNIEIWNFVKEHPERSKSFGLEMIQRRDHF